MIFLNRYLCTFVLILRLWKSSLTYSGAPGTLTLKIHTPPYVEGCTEKDCKYVLETCIGSGRSESERCLWSANKTFSNDLQKMTKYLAEISFEVDNVKSSLYFNADLSYHQDDKILKKERFKDFLFQYSNSPVQVHSQDFTSLTIDILIECKTGFYPKNECTTSCFDNPSIHKCNEFGKKICLKGYVFDSLNNQCNTDNCMLETNFCQNNGTCFNSAQGPKCLCTNEFSGDSCDKWDPCLKFQCQNGGQCMKSESVRKYFCACKINYFGEYCEKYQNTCDTIICINNEKCEIIDQKAKCVTIKPKSVTKTTLLNVVTSASFALIPTRKFKSISSNIDIKKISIENVPIEKGSNRLLQSHPFMNEYTTVSIVIVLVVFMMGCFGVAFWILKIKYFHKKSTTYSNFSTLPAMPSIFNASTYRSGEENFRRWHSLDDNSFYICNQPHIEPYHTYRSGSNVWPKHDQIMDTYRDTYGSLNSPHRMCHSVMRTRMPILCEPSTINSSDLNFNVVNDSQNNSEKVDDFNSNYLVIDNPPTSDL